MTPYLRALALALRMRSASEVPGAVTSESTVQLTLAGSLTGDSLPVSVT